MGVFLILFSLNLATSINLITFEEQTQRDMKNLIKKYTTEQGQMGLWFVDPKMASLTEAMAVFMARTTGNEFVVDGNTIRKV